MKSCSLNPRGNSWISARTSDWMVASLRPPAPAARRLAMSPNWSSRIRVSMGSWAVTPSIARVRPAVQNCGMSMSAATHPSAPELVGDELRERFASLTAKEFDVVRDALVWHFKYMRPTITKSLDDTSMPAEHYREKFRELHSGMSKLGIRVRSPLPPLA